MRIPFRWTQRLARPSTLWVVYAVVLLTTGFGLVVLSEHALRLSREQSEGAAREAIEQNIRVALWRLDSRLAPYLATVNDLPGGVPASQPRTDHVIVRFQVERRAAGKGEQERWTYVPIDQRGVAFPLGIGSAWETLRQTVPVETIVSHVDTLTTGYQSPNNQSLVQSYGVPQVIDDISISRELDNRNTAVQSQVAMNSAQFLSPSQNALPSFSAGQATGVTLVPVWVNDELVILRAGTLSGLSTLQGAWLDWAELRQSLLQDIDDLLPAASLQSVSPDEVVDPSRTLAALPAMIVPKASGTRPITWSATHTALSIAWLTFLGAASIAAVALARLITLSERRASFVSAVTHELRTPLTTFRLYSDLLARDIVSDPNDRREYLQTLQREADRLTHLVDNVLRYSRLQRNGKRPELESVVVSDWVTRITPRLTERLSSVDMELAVEQSGDGQWKTDPAAMEQVIFNLIDNAAKYARTATDRRVHFNVTVNPAAVTITVIDHGPGVPPKLKSTLFRPFSKSAERAAETAAGVGLGLALARQTVATLRGKLDYRPARAAMSESGAAFVIVMPRGV